MKIAHLADLHIGKLMGKNSILEDQKYILQQIMDLCVQKEVDVICIAGDVYDRSVPSAEAMKLLEWFLAELVHKNFEVFMIAGNHDSGDRLGYGSELFENVKIHIVGNYEGSVPMYTLEDSYGKIHFTLLPFIRPLYVNRYIEDEKDKIVDYSEAVTKALSTVEINEEERNIILTHQFVTGCTVDENGSEELIVGGLDQVSASCYDAFDYVCMGHIHRPQKVGRDTMVYAGTPLKYSFSEVNQVKRLPIVTFEEKGKITIESIPLTPLHEMIEYKGKFLDLMKKKKRDDFIHITLTDEDDIPEAIRDLRQLFPNILKFDYDNKRTQNTDVLQPKKEMLKKDPMNVFETFFEERNQHPLSDEQRKVLSEIIASIKGEQE